MAQPRADLLTEALAPHHDRDGFSCGKDSLDRYLRTQAGQDVRRKANAVFILVEASKPDVVVGYYTLCATALPQGDVPAAARKHVPRYPLVSAALIGRLAVSKDRQGRGFGAILLADAVRRAYGSAAIVGSSMLIVDAMNDRATTFYESHGFQPLCDSHRLVLPMRTIQHALDS